MYAIAAKKILYSINFECYTWNDVSAYLTVRFYYLIAILESS